MPLEVNVGTGHLDTLQLESSTHLSSQEHKDELKQNSLKVSLFISFIYTNKVTVSVCVCPAETIFV